MMVMELLPSDLKSHLGQISERLARCRASIMIASLLLGNMELLVGIPLVRRTLHVAECIIVVCNLTSATHAGMSVWRARCAH